MVFMEIEIQRRVTLPPDELEFKDALLLRKAIIIRLLADIARRSASKEHGYYLAVNTLNSIGDGLIDDLTGEVIFPISFSCTAMKPCKGEILIGAIEKVMRHGVFLTIGPMKNIFLSEKTMKDYKFYNVEEPVFLNENQNSRMEKGGKVKFKVIGIKWIECDREFQVLASLAGDFLGPV